MPSMQSVCVLHRRGICDKCKPIMDEMQQDYANLQALVADKPQHSCAQSPAEMMLRANIDVSSRKMLVAIVYCDCLDMPDAL